MFRVNVLACPLVWLSVCQTTENLHAAYFSHEMVDLCGVFFACVCVSFIYICVCVCVCLEKTAVTPSPPAAQTLCVFALFCLLSLNDRTL